MNLPSNREDRDAMRILASHQTSRQVGVVVMRTNLISGFQMSVNYWFDLVLQGMGGPIRDWVYDFLDKKGIKREDIPSRFEDVVKILHERLGTSARVIASGRWLSFTKSSH